MAKKMPSASIINIQGCVSYQHHKGTIRENALLALLSDKLFHQRIEKKRKGKGSYQRKTKHKGKRFENPIIKFLVTEV